MPLVSIIVLNWNGIENLKKCLPSLLKATYTSLEIIVVDNNSTDGSQQFVKKNYSKVILVENKDNYGFAKGNNIGFAKSKGEYVLILNNDTVITPSFFEPLVEEIKKDNKIGCIQPQIRLMEDRGLLDGVGAYLTSTGFLYHFGYLKEAAKLMYGKQTKIFSAKGACMLLNRKAIEKIGLFDEDFFIFFEETDLCFRLWLAGFIVVYDPKSIVYHMGGADTTSSDSYRYERRAYLTLRNMLCSYIKNFGTVNLLTIFPIFIFLEIGLAFYYLLTLRFNLMFVVFRAFFWNIKNLENTLRKRNIVQHKFRTTSDMSLDKQIIRNPTLRYFYYLLVGKLNAYQD